jgi:hypothetical protein
VAYGSSPVLTIDSPVLRDSVVQKITRSAELAKERGEPDYYTSGGAISFDAAVAREVRRMFGHQHNQWMHQLSQLDVDALVAADRLRDFTHDFVPGTGWIRKDPSASPTAEQVNAWSFFGMGHDSTNQWVCVKARCARMGVGDTCLRCDGHGERWEPEEMKAKAEEWSPIEPPAGDGWQLWETTSEGSPISPVFGSPQELADWCADNATVFGSEKTSRDNWLKMFETESGVEVGSFFVMQGSYCGTIANQPS